MPNTAAAVDEVVAKLRQSRRYRTLADATLRRAARAALQIEPGRVAVAVKRAKRDLHEIHGACTGAPLPCQRLAHDIGRAVAANDEVILRRELIRILRRHASTAERLALLDRFYQAIFALTGPPVSIVDLACGLHPLAWPWMRLASDVPYTAIDSDASLIGVVDHCLGQLGVAHDAFVADVIDLTPPAADVTLLLKAIPSLERQQRGAGFDLVDRVATRVLVTSFPTASLGGRSKGMRQSYAATFRREAASRGWRFDQESFPTETVYVIWK
jgi:16S rRNA (guanine(1405)-N(7))-methyltransferase